MQHVVAVVELKYPDGVVGLCFLLSPAKFIAKEWEHFFFFVFFVYCFTSIYCMSEWLKWYFRTIWKLLSLSPDF